MPCCWLNPTSVSSCHRPGLDGYISRVAKLPAKTVCSSNCIETYGLYYVVDIKCGRYYNFEASLIDPVVEAQVYGNMGITKMNVGVMEEAIGYLEQQLATLQQLSGNEALMDRGRAYGNLGDCYEALGDFEEAIKYYDQYLSVAQSLDRMQDQEKAYRGLGNGHR